VVSLLALLTLYLGVLPEQLHWLAEETFRLMAF
jgi:hypothetical protein